MVDVESVPLIVSVTVVTSLVFVVMRVVVPGGWVVRSAVVVSVVGGVSIVEVLVGMVVVGFEEGVEGSIVVVFSSDVVTMVVDVVAGVVTGGVVVVIAVLLFSCLFSSTNSTISSTTSKADTVEKHSKSVAIKRKTSRLFIANRFLWERARTDVDRNEAVIADQEVNVKTEG